MDSGSYTPGVFNCTKTYLRAGTYTMSFSTPINVVRMIADDSYNIVNGIGYTNVTSITFTTKTDGYFGISFRDTTDSTTIWDTSNSIQIEEGSVATEYEPYIDPTTVTVRRLGKNLFPVNEVTLAKTNAWGLQPMGQVILAPGTYTARCKFKQTGVDKSTVSLSIRDHSDAMDTIATANSTGISGVLETTFEVTSERKGIQIYLYSNNTANALNTECVFTDIQLELGSEPTEFEKYITFESYTPAVDGTVAVTSISPTMTIYAITPGVTIDAEYNRDTNYVIGAIKDDALTAITTLPSGTTNVWELQSGLYRVPSTVIIKASNSETLIKPEKKYAYLYVSGRDYTGSTDKKYVIGWAYMVCSVSDGGGGVTKIFTGSTYTTGAPKVKGSALATMDKVDEVKSDLKEYVDKAIGGIENGSY
jgi:hypothetical protein